MSVNKHINVNDGSGRKYEDNTVGEIVLDTKPELGSFNLVTSDAVARAVAGASGEVPQVTEDDNGKVLKAVYDEGGPGVEWGEAGSSVSVDQSYDPTSENAQSGTAVAEAVGGVLPSITDQAGKVLAVNSGATGLEWVSGGGGGGDTIAPYTLRFKFQSTSFDPSTSITGTGGTWTRVSSDPNIWDWTNESWGWGNSFLDKSFSSTAAVIGSGDLSGVTTMQAMFKRVRGLAYVKMGHFGSTCDFTDMFQLGQYVTSELRRVEFGYGDENVYGSMSGMFNAGSGSTYVPLVIKFNGIIAATSLNRFAYKRKYLSKAPEVETYMSGHPCTNFNEAFSGCESLSIVPTLPTFSTFSYTTASFYETFQDCKSLTVAPDMDLRSANSVYGMFSGCESLVHVPDYDVSSATSVYGMFSGCHSLTKIPNLTGLTGKSMLDHLFEDCYGIQTGADTLYQQLSSQATPPTSTIDTFKNCGAATVTGSAALATIPASWGGTGA